MSKPFNLVMPMAGLGSRFSIAGYELPKPYLELHGKPLFYWAVKSITTDLIPNRLVFVVLEEHIIKHKVDNIIKSYFPSSEILSLSATTDGAVSTCISGCQYLEDELPVIFNDCDHAFLSKDFTKIILDDSDNSDGLLLTFKSTDPKYSFVIQTISGSVTRTVEKVAVSDRAICGCYYFKSANLFRVLAKEYARSCPYPELFMSGIYNSLIRLGGTVRAIKSDINLSMGIPEDYEKVKSTPLDLLFH